MNHHHIVIEGALGAGKTSLAKKLAEYINGQELLEHTEDNPFLDKFYKDPKRYRFQIQMFFLMRRYQHSIDLAQLDLFKKTIVGDFLFDKDRLYAKVNLDDSEFWLYEQLFHVLKKRVKPPDLVVYLQAKTEVLTERIKKRKADYEKSINYKYLDQINQAFNDYFFHYTESPLLVVNASEIDFVNIKEDFEDLVNEIKQIKSGVQYYMPVSSR
ncbi:MAG: deoxynucleoside kinase [Deltaproteobacteria bacterium]|nr:deoxynucleoside kinase [Deltaproteobacteria bacterium]